MSDLPVLEDRLRTLMLASLAGDAASYRCLLSDLENHLRRYFQRRLRSDMSNQIEDLVQETLLAIHTRRAAYDPHRPFTVWVYAIARYKLTDLLRRSHYREYVPIDDVADFLPNETDNIEFISACRDLDRMLETLPGRVSNLIRRIKVEDQSVAEVATATGMSESAVKVTVHRGLKALAGRFGSKS